MRKQSGAHVSAETPETAPNGASGRNCKQRRQFAVIVFKWMILVLPVFEMAGQTQPAVSIQVHPRVAGRSIRDGQVTTVYLAPRYATAIRMPEAINSVVVGDPGSFSAEHSDREPQLVFVK